MMLIYLGGGGVLYIHIPSVIMYLSLTLLSIHGDSCDYWTLSLCTCYALRVYKKACVPTFGFLYSVRLLFRCERNSYLR